MPVKVFKDRFLYKIVFKQQHFTNAKADIKTIAKNTL